MKLENLLENSPLYKEIIVSHSGLLPIKNFYSMIEPLQMPCGTCKDMRTFLPLSVNYDEYYKSNTHTIRTTVNTGEPYILQYFCANCRKSKRHFAVAVQKSGNKYHIQKIGQFPAYSITPEKPMEKYLDRKGMLDIYRNGITCESQGYGVGAFAYYRQILENIINDILDDIIPLSENEEAIREKVSEAKKEDNTSKKIEIVKDFVPKALKPSGNNVFITMYKVLSEGIHNKDDQACLEDADALRFCLVFIVQTLQDRKQSEAAFSESLNKLKKSD